MLQYLIIMTALSAPAAKAPTATVLPVRTDCFIRGDATLIASADELSQENRTAVKCRISAIRDKDNLKWFIQQGLLVPLKDDDAENYRISPDLAEGDPDEPELYLYARPWTRTFIENISTRAVAEIGVRLMITSLVRPEEYQQRLRDYNSYAARESTHPTGATVDFSEADMTWRQRNWLRNALLDLERKGLVEATEERGNYCMHVFVHPAYGPYAAAAAGDQEVPPPKAEPSGKKDAADPPKATDPDDDILKYLPTSEPSP